MVNHLNRYEIVG